MDGEKNKWGNIFGLFAQNVDFTLTFFDACVIYSICKADSHRKMWS